jgi:hypothetical protein
VEKIGYGEKLSTGDKVKIRDYATSHHEKEIKELRACNYEPLFAELQKVTITATSKKQQAALRQPAVYFL